MNQNEIRQSCCASAYPVALDSDARIYIVVEKEYIYEGQKIGREPHKGERCGCASERLDKAQSHAHQDFGPLRVS